MHYLDNAATTQVDPAVVQTVTQVLENNFANPSSLYALGMEAEQVIQKARETVAQAMGCAPNELVFTGSGTEGCNIAVLGLARARKSWGGHLVATGYEHPAVASPLAMLAQKEGFNLTLVPPGPDGQVDIDALAAAVTPKTSLVCAMQVNNETGAMVDVAALAQRVKQNNPRTAVHVDAVQGFGKVPVCLADTLVDSYAVSGHKLHAPKGVGALFLRKKVNLWPPFLGGGQEDGRRPGTQNTAYIAGFAKAVELALQNLPSGHEQALALRQRLLKGLADLPGAEINSPAAGYLSIVNFSLPGIRSEVMLHFLEARGVYVSSGSACSKGQASHTLRAMGLPAARLDSALRVSFGRYSTQEDVDALLEGLHEGVKTLARSR